MISRGRDFPFHICESSGIVSKYHYRYTIKYNKPRKSVDVGKQSTGSLEIREPRDCTKRSTNY